MSVLMFETGVADRIATVTLCRAPVNALSEEWGEAVKAYVVCASGASAPEAEVIAHCKRLIAGYKCPKHVEAIGELPRVASGKVNKVALRERARNSK
jgi:acyl-CoA synthetase (AMP-forming)/AMP-acid ligase II